MNRRKFLAAGGATATTAWGLLNASGSTGAGAEQKKLRIRVVYSLHARKQDRPDWPNVGFDFEPFMARTNADLRRKFKQFEFVESLATGEPDAKSILNADAVEGKVDGYLVFQMNCWNRVVQTLATSGKPVLYADFQFGGSGGFLVYNAAFLREQTPNVGFVASSDPDDLMEAVRCFEVVAKGGTAAEFAAATAKARAGATPKRGNLACQDDDLVCLSTDDCMRHLKESRILAFRGEETRPVEEILGIQVVHLPFSELNQAWKDADQDESSEVADQWQKSARRVAGVTQETLKTSAAMYLAEKALLKKHGAQAITINCLGGFYGGHIHAYPCLGFHQLLNEGLVGGCECDVRSAATMLAVTTLTQGRPGYISDPVIDTSKRQIIYAHCVAANRAFGPDGPANPFEILTHSEDRQGASVRSLLPVGYMTTTLELDKGRQEILFHQGKAVANDPDDRACRTKLCAEPVGDIEKLFAEWDQWGWHRVTVYGDLKQPIHDLAEAVGWKVRSEA